MKQRTISKNIPNLFFIGSTNICWMPVMGLVVCIGNTKSKKIQLLPERKTMRINERPEYRVIRCLMEIILTECCESTAGCRVLWKKQAGRAFQRRWYLRWVLKGREELIICRREGRQSDNQHSERTCIWRPICWPLMSSHHSVCPEPGSWGDGCQAG